MTKLSTLSTAQQLPHGMTVSSAKTSISTWPFLTPCWAFHGMERRLVLKISQNITILGITKARRTTQSFALATAMPYALCTFFPFIAAYFIIWNGHPAIIIGAGLMSPSFILIVPSIPISSAPLAEQGSTAHSLCTLRMPKRFS